MSCCFALEGRSSRKQRNQPDPGSNLTLRFTSCLFLCKELPLSEPLSPHLYSGQTFTKVSFSEVPGALLGSGAGRGWGWV